ncbi:MAG TPA: hypothetical protein VFG68_07655 [Fimbriiglobus sp.]|nr:hypothetical protein [Fimbriiglobus sp.]
MSKFYAGLSAVLIGLYTASAVLGWEFMSYSREDPQQSTARHRSGGHRSFWIAGYRGGK